MKIGDKHEREGGIMERERIIRVWKFAYIKLFDILKDEVTFQDKKAVWDASRLIWRIYWLKRDESGKVCCDSI